MSLIHRVGWVQTLEKNVTKFYVTNWEGSVGSNLNLYDVTIEVFPKQTLFLLCATLLFSDIKLERDGIRQLKKSSPW